VAAFFEDFQSCGTTAQVRSRAVAPDDGHVKVGPWLAAAMAGHSHFTALATDNQRGNLAA
tara:strand:- start:270 stop:449 length:180 start_codon:yes stop_codon:yes gene_type:complete